ncbi:MAG: hypothetical protein A3F31_01860 [Candidatus Levybacteria bacterium RIFCSPHIGHO2_12_FULL_38_12]|nr:MAG: hypothetical protein A2770_00745 [Candidatus Levybacteria bacterium RIFCSPHIGHO2_01_FULL_38_12]OGH22424.1 MAG: hypothetical protein A3D75_00065 [Candidatus Levybacteria bacterium RIFCSPHIGHO2_02_FULL_37_18]OGH23389.1 MAG: hypothetical protein A3F31_01860 [Candidatus Levybacteria bacterium RIFCSPHIGHO2_12_FULL_38_12]OGH34898.1 MAG: hypothetical protein A3A47_00440 [Candidatus Levybacteria bacterium RIFCSPLOWO2_01_FULL_37_20]OGH43640.1 MAG: hypothetical protein A3J14_02835 [Candidatus Lev
MQNYKYQPVIGLEVHVELKTKSKMFCRCSAEHFGQEPNTHTCPVCLGLPGALPVPNKTAIEWCVMIGLALSCEIPLFSKFDRKNYFYPDLAKGYQISQYDQPFAINGKVVIARNEATKQSLKKEIATTPSVSRNDAKVIRIRRVHMEEDTAKLMHQFGTQNSNIKTQNEEKYSLIDFNRSGVPLVEIVTEPDFSSADEVTEYLKKLQQIVRYLDVSNADMEKGDMRLEPNISLKKVSLRGMVSEVEPDRAISRDRHANARDDNKELPKYKVEVKNINSFRFVDKAIRFELKRQAELLDKRETPAQETRGWDEKKGATVSQRSKEEAHDYRYFPEPDIPPVRWTESQISNLKSQMCELPDTKFNRFQKEYKLNEYDAEILTREQELADYFEEAVKVGKEHNITSKSIANTIINRKINTEQVLPAELIKNIIQISQTFQINPDELEKIVEQVLSENQKAVDDYKKGETQIMGFLIGRIKQHFPSSDTNQIKKALETSILNT